MNKIFNGLSVVSFLLSASVVGAGLYGYFNREKLIEGLINKALPDLVEKALPPVPAIPSMTGGVKL